MNLQFVFEENSLYDSIMLKFYHFLKKHSTKDADGKKKAKKRTRIVMKEPKEKMTMFDYIYYNPQR